jgi:hypothetical protein
MSWDAFNHVRDHSRAKAPVKSVLLMIAYRANEKEGHTCFPGIKTLARDTGLSERTIRKGIEWGTKNGEISVLQRGGYRGGRAMANLYQVNFKRHDLPVDNRHDTPVIDGNGEILESEQAPQTTEEAPSAGDNRHLRVVEQAYGAAQPEVEPEVVKEKIERKEVTASDSSIEEEDIDLPPAEESSFGIWLKAIPRLTSYEGRVDEGRARDLFMSLIASGYESHHLLDAVKGAGKGEADGDFEPFDGNPESILDPDVVDDLISRVSPRHQRPEAVAA